MLGKPMIVVGTKLDLMRETEQREALEAHVAGRGFEFFVVSSLAGQGLRELLRRVEGLVLKPVSGGGLDEEEEEAEESADEYGNPPHLLGEEEQLPGSDPGEED